MDENPFPDLKISSPDFLNTLDGRSSCPKCGKSRKYYCYTCYVPVNEVKDKVPYVQLPIKIDIIKHPKEVDGKSTAVHAGVLAPDQVNIYSYPCIPDYDKTRTVLVYPGEHSVTLEQLAAQMNLQNRGGVAESVDAESSNEPECKRTKMEEHPQKPAAPFDKVVFIDSTWYQSKKVFKDERLSGLKHVEMKSYLTKFWRHQKDKPSTYLATIEAVYYFVREFHQQFISDDYSGEYDNLLFLFNFMYHKIREFYDGGHMLMAYGGERAKKLRTKKKKKREQETDG